MKAIDLDAEGRRRLLASLSFDPGMAHWLVGADTALCMHLAQDLALMGPRLASGRPRRRFAGLRGAAPGVNAVFGMETLFPELSVLDNLFIGRPVHWRRPAELIARAREAFAVLGSDLQPEGSARDLSDLQRQSLALARAILTPAPLTVIHCEPDEPVVAAQLNRAGRQLLRLRQHSNLALLPVGHGAAISPAAARRGLTLRSALPCGRLSLLPDPAKRSVRADERPERMIR